LAALYIGFKQVEIKSQQAEISLKQTEISKSLLDIPFTVSVDVVYEPGSKRLNVHNKGQTNIYLWGSKLGDGPQVLEKAPVLITPGGFYYIFADSLEACTRTRLSMLATTCKLQPLPARPVRVTRLNEVSVTWVEKIFGS